MNYILWTAHPYAVLLVGFAMGLCSMAVVSHHLMRVQLRAIEKGLRS